MRARPKTWLTTNRPTTPSIAAPILASANWSFDTMAIVAKGSNFVPCPAGLHQAVCADVIDNGMVEGVYGTKHKVTLVFQVNVSMDNGKPFLVQRRYTLSLDQKANLRKDLESWRGKPFSADELKGFDLEKLLGVNAQLNVQQTDRDGTTYANITAIVPLGKGMPKMKVAGYVRKQDREPDTEPGATTDDDTFEADNSAVPF
jgi:hypothetical protein